MITFKTYKAGGIVAFTQSEQFGSFSVIPVSPQRAVSISRQPETNPDDVILVCAYSGDELVGYLGLLPGIFNANGNVLRAGWLSSMWVSSEHRGKRIAPGMINTMLDSWNNAIITTNQSPVAALVFGRHKAFVTVNNVGTRFYVRSRISYLFERKDIRVPVLKTVLNIADKMLNLLQKVNWLTSGIQRKPYYKTMRFADEKLNVFINEKQKDHFSKRHASSINCMQEFPWLTSSKTKDPLSARYEFTISTHDYRNEAIVCYDADNNIIAAAWVMLKNGELKISYAWYQKDILPILSGAIRDYILNNPVFEVTVFSKDTRAIMLYNSALWFYTRNIPRHYYMSQPVYELYKSADNNLYDGDGDCFFA